MTPIAIGVLRLTIDANGTFARAITIAGEEVFRGIGFVVRDRNWATPALAGTCEIEHAPGRIVARGRGRLSLEEAVLDWTTEWTVTEAGLIARARFASPTGFDTARTGFVALHSLGAARGRDVRITHPGGEVDEQTFPDLVSPHQPFFDIAGMDYITAAGHGLHIAFDNEVFETEDQRNWTDASYKTYCRPLARPFPFTIRDTTEQGVRVAFSPIAISSVGAAAPPTVAKRTAMPALGTALPPGAMALGTGAALRQLAPAFTAIEIDLFDEDWAARTMEKIQATPGQIRLDLRPHAQQIAAIGTLLPHLQDGRLLAVSLWGADDATLADARHLLPDVAIGGGTGAFFTELNRMTAWPARADYLAWTSNPTVHGDSDDTLGESIEPLNDILRTALATLPVKRFQIGPLTLGMRFNPNATTEEGRRRAAAPDPRQGTLIAAAWLVGTVAGYAENAVTALTFFEPIGPKGLLAADGAVTPAGHVFTRLAALAGQETQILVWPGASRVRGLRILGPETTVLCLANAHHDTVHLPLPDGRWGAAPLTPEGFGPEATADHLDLGGFSVSWLTLHHPQPG